MFVGIVVILTLGMMVMMPVMVIMRLLVDDEGDDGDGDDVCNSGLVDAHMVMTYCNSILSPSQSIHTVQWQQNDKSIN